MLLRALRALQISPLEPLLTGAPYAPYRGAVLRYLAPDVTSVLEAGCGRGNLARAMRRRCPEVQRTALDIFRPYVRRVHEHSY